MYSTHNEDTSVITERFIKILKAKIYKIMRANDSKSCLSYLDKLEGQYNKTYHYSFNKKNINADYSALTEKIKTILKLLILKLKTESKLVSIRIV